LALAQRGISFDGADQGLLNMHFQDWERLSFTYNCTPNSSYQYIPAYRHFQSSISMIHFIGKDKPWTLGRDHKKSTGVYGELLGRWWATYDKHYRIPASIDRLDHKRTFPLIGKQKTPSQTVQSQVIGEPLPTAPSQPPPSSQPAFSFTPATTDVPSAENITTPVEPPMGDKPEVVEEIQHGDFKPTPTVEQRRFSAPHSDWNPAR
jgi:glycogenin glucosyltransferase